MVCRVGEKRQADSGTHLHRIGGVAVFARYNGGYCGPGGSHCGIGHSNGTNLQEEIESSCLVEDAL